MKKLNLIDLKDQVLSRDEMKTIMAGSGGYACPYVVDNNSGWWGRLESCEKVTHSSSWSGSATIGASMGSGGAGYEYSTTTSTEVCHYSTYDPHNVGYEKKVESVSGAVARQC